MSSLNEMMNQQKAAFSRYPWLQWLAKAYSVTDEGISRELRDLERRGAATPACHEGCCECCLRNDIVLSQLEFQGLSWFISEVLENPLREAVKTKLLIHIPDHESPTVMPCPFLIDRRCAVYPMRPLTCRIFYVIGNGCTTQRDFLKVRRDTCMQFDRSMLQKGATAILQGLGYGSARICRNLAARGELVRIVRSLHDIPLRELVRTMEEFEKPHGQSAGCS
jgi:uncharacterized protein